MCSASSSPDCCNPRGHTPHLPVGTQGPLCAHLPKFIIVFPVGCTRTWSRPLNCTWFFLVIPRDCLMWNLELCAHVLEATRSHTGPHSSSLGSCWNCPHVIPHQLSGEFDSLRTVILACLLKLSCFTCLAKLRCSYWFIDLKNRIEIILCPYSSFCFLSSCQKGGWWRKSQSKSWKEELGRNIEHFSLTWKFKS